MRKGKIVVWSLVVICLVLSLTVGVSAQKTVEMSVAAYVAKGTPEVDGLEYLKKILEERSKGQIKVNVFYGGVVGGEGETIEQARTGALQLSIGAWSTIDTYAREYCPWVVPYLFPDRDAIIRSWEGRIGQGLREAFEKNNLIFNGVYFRGNRQLTTNKLVTKPEDLAGLKLRLPQTAAWIVVWEELGALPTPVPSPEIYSALQMGVVDAQENPIASNYGRRIWEVQKYMVMTNHIVDFNGYFMCKSWFDGLSAAHKKLVDQAVADALAYTQKISDESEARMLQEMIDNGIQIIEPDLELFREKALPAVDRVKKDWAPWVYDEALKVTTGQ